MALKDVEALEDLSRFEIFRSKLQVVQYSQDFVSDTQESKSQEKKRFAN